MMVWEHMQLHSISIYTGTKKRTKSKSNGQRQGWKEIIIWKVLLQRESWYCYSCHKKESIVVVKIQNMDGVLMSLSLRLLPDPLLLSIALGPTARRPLSLSLIWSNNLPHLPHLPLKKAYHRFIPRSAKIYTSWRSFSLVDILEG